MAELYEVVFVVAASVFVFGAGLVLATAVRGRRQPWPITMQAASRQGRLVEIVLIAAPLAVTIALLAYAWRAM